MRIYRQLDELAVPAAPVVATIGNFDGVHLGHQGVIAEVIARAHFLGGQSLAITFDPHPTRVLRPEHAQPLITPLPRKLELLANTGIDATLVLPFTEALSRRSAREFATQVLVRAIHVTEVHEGANFRFGYHAEAGVTGPTGLQALGRELGFTVTLYAPRSLRGGPVSSSRIRALIAAGEVSRARALLGVPFSVDSTPVSGRGFGARYAVPTINLAPYSDLLPAQGVYITTLTVGTGPGAETFQAVTNLGTRPTFGEASFAVESHLLDFHPIPLTGQTPLRLTFLRRLRAEERFANPEALREQIARDVTRTRRYFALSGCST
ncbi:MAG: bifunctional riboflavin kinase/FMN adenylyltransferase [Acidobacteriaceae bacterium]